MKKIFCAAVLGLVSSLCFSLEFSPFVRRIIDAGPQQMAEIVETTGGGAFNLELVRLVNSLSYRDPYFYSFDRLDPYSARQLAEYYARMNSAGGSADDLRWLWDKVWNVLMIGSGLIYDQNVGAYEADINRLYELARRPVDIRNSRYENDLIGFARLMIRPLPDHRARLPLPAPAPGRAAAGTVPPPAAPVSVSGPARIVPRMPDPGNGRVYRIQTGSYRDIEHALEAVLRLRGVGFFPAYELNSGYYRVVIPGIPASDMIIAAQLLGSAGFAEAWIREEW
jgi:hypothetical protein